MSVVSKGKIKTVTIGAPLREWYLRVTAPKTPACFPRRPRMPRGMNLRPTGNQS